uniref:Uncharacterized protein n=1 Tax=Oryza rufipogon TaxID=4529 RepID=A0A0E0PHL6_ORYRU
MSATESRGFFLLFPRAIRNQKRNPRRRGHPNPRGERRRRRRRRRATDCGRSILVGSPFLLAAPGIVLSYWWRCSSSGGFSTAE